MNLVHHPGLDELRFGNRGRHFEDRLVRKDRRALGDGAHVAAEPEPLEILEKAAREAAKRVQVRERRLVEA